MMVALIIVYIATFIGVIYWAFTQGEIGQEMKTLEETQRKSSENLEKLTQTLKNREKISNLSDDELNNRL